MSGALSAPPSIPSGHAPGKVLIVDDNVDLVSTLKSVLALSSARSFEVTSAAKGSDALEIAENSGFDVAIVDVKLPDVSGVDLIEGLRKASPHGEVVLITGFASVDAAIGALRSGAFAFVLKSFRPEELISIVEQAFTKVELKREREELERRYRDLVDLTDVLVVALDGEGKVALLNPKASSMVGISGDEALGKHFSSTWLPVEDGVAFNDAFERTMNDAGGKRGQDVETSLLGAESAASKRRIRWHLSRARGEGALVYGIGIDVTERRLLERRAADAEAMSAMGELALNLAHEIRNPLNAAVLQLHMLGRNIDKLDAEEAVRAQLRKRAEIVGDEIGRLNRLLTEFLELSRPRQIAREPVHLAELVENVLEMEVAKVEGANLSIVREITSEGGVAVGDAAKLKQVVLNLVVNALEAMKDGGTLTARVRAEGDRVVMEVEDTGSGIDKETLANVFDPFFTTKEAGTGLGLSIVRKIIDQHNGDVRIASERNKGTRVTVEIPRAR